MTIKLPENNDNFCPFFPVVMSFIYDSYNILAIFFTTILNNSGDSRHLHLLLDFNRHGCSHSSISMMLMFEVHIHYHNNKIFFYSLKAKDKCWIFIKCFFSIYQGNNMLKGKPFTCYDKIFYYHIFLILPIHSYLVKAHYYYYYFACYFYNVKLNPSYLNFS